VRHGGLLPARARGTVPGARSWSSGPLVVGGDAGETRGETRGRFSRLTRVSPGDVRRKNRLLINSNYLCHPDFWLPVSDFRFSLRLPTSGLWLPLFRYSGQSRHEDGSFVSQGRCETKEPSADQQ